MRRSRATYVRPNRRQFPRTDMKARVDIEVELNVPDGPGGHVSVPGEIINIGYGGMLVKVDRALKTRIGCLVKFLDAEGVIEPVLRWGNIIRAHADGDLHGVAIEFQTPLDTLKVWRSGRLVELKEVASIGRQRRPTEAPTGYVLIDS